MKVYTHYRALDTYTIDKKGNQIKNGIRWRTLLQYGSSWEIIGSVVMMNPGSASPLHEITDKEILSRLLPFDENANEIWYEFSEDNAMKDVGSLFAYYQEKTSRHDLEGVIQIFNLFYLRDADLERAKRQFSQQEPYLAHATDEDIRHLTEHQGQPLYAPIYLGFGSLAKDKRFQDKAHTFWVAVRQRMHYLHPIFEENKFYYPSYILGRGKNKPCSRLALARFKANKYNLSPKELEALNIPTSENTNTEVKSIPRRPQAAKKERAGISRELFQYLLKKGSLSPQGEGFKKNQEGIVFQNGRYEIYTNSNKNEMLQIFFKTDSAFTEEQKQVLFSQLTREFGFSPSPLPQFSHRLSLSSARLGTGFQQKIQEILRRIRQLLD